MNSKSQEKWPIIWRGICGHCPKCGNGNLFKSYLKQNDACPACDEDFSKIRADDGPAWLTILLVGHILAPFFIFFAMSKLLPPSTGTPLLVALALILTFLILPRAKGLFIAAIWLITHR